MGSLLWGLKLFRPSWRPWLGVCRPQGRAGEDSTGQGGPKSAPHHGSSFGSGPGWPCPRKQSCHPQATCLCKGGGGKGSPRPFPGTQRRCDWRLGTGLPAARSSWPELGSPVGWPPTWALAVMSSRSWRVMDPRASIWSLSQGSWSPGPSLRGEVGVAEKESAPYEGCHCGSAVLGGLRLAPSCPRATLGLSPASPPSSPTRVQQTSAPPACVCVHTWASV